MPTCLSSPFKRKKPKHASKRFLQAAYVLLFLFSPLIFFGQGLTGLWVGNVSNDSATVRKDQSFEIALTEYKDKVYGYSRSEFIVNDTLYYIVKRVKGKIEGDVCEVTDDEIISYNFLGKLDKGVKVTSIFRRNKSDSSWYLDGTWKTNATKKYYSVGGKVTLDEEKDLAASKLFPHLEELNLANDVAFYKERVEGAPIVKLAKPEKIKTEYFSPSFTRETNVNPVISVTSLQRKDSKEPVDGIAANQKDVAPNETGLNKMDEEVVDQAFNKKIDRPSADLPKTNTGKPSGTTVNIQPAEQQKSLVKNQVPVEDVKPVETKATSSSIAVVKTTPDKETMANRPPVKNVSGTEEVNKPLTKISTAKTEPIKPVINNPANKPADKTTLPKENAVVKSETTVPGKNVQPSEKTSGIINTTIQQKPSASNVISPITETKKPTVDVVALAANIGGRKSEFTQMVSFKSDSLELSLYDNGEIDGDTVSIFLNGEVVMSRQGLKSTAIRKTIYIKPGQEEFTLVLFAENLGKYPPNTGLLVVHDGEDVYNLRFSSDFQKNAGIIFKRKK